MMHHRSELIIHLFFLSSLVSVLNGDRGDAVIVGGSSLEHLESNLESCAAKDANILSAQVTDAFDRASSITKPVCPSYFR